MPWRKIPLTKGVITRMISKIKERLRNRGLNTVDAKFQCGICEKEFTTEDKFVWTNKHGKHAGYRCVSCKKW